MIRSLAFARDLAAVHHIIPDTVDWNVEMSLFNSGKAAFLISGPWAYGSLNWSGVPIGISALPVLSQTGKFPSPFLGVKGFFVNAHSPYRERLGETLQHLTSAFSGCLMNCLAGYLPANRLAYEFNALSAHPITAKFEEHIDSAILMPANSEMGYVWRVMIRDDAIDHPGALDRVFLFGASPESAVEEAWRRYQAYASEGR
jgi:maltose-binding protein MalE